MSDHTTHTSMEGTGRTSSDGSDAKVGDALGHFINGVAPQEPFKTVIRGQPVTHERKPYVPQEGDRLINAGSARATIAASKESPNGTTDGNYAKDHQHQTVITSFFPEP